MTKQKLLLTLAVGLALATTVVMASQFAARFNWSRGGEYPTTNEQAILQQPRVVAQSIVEEGNIPDLSAMTMVFTKMLQLNAVQQEEVQHQNEKAYERITETRQRTEVDEEWKQREINRLMKFRDTQVLRVLQPIQANKWQQFKEGNEAINSLKKLNEKAPAYLSGKAKYYPESEYGEFQSAEQIQKLKTELETTVKASGFTSEQITEFNQIIYKFN